MNPTLTAALIAGGKSSRMGRDKALLDWNGRPLWQHQLETLQALSPAEILICRADNPPLPAIDARHIPDLLPSRGPLGAIAAALETASTSHLLVLAIDLPHITPDFLKTLLAKTTPDTGIVPKSNHFYEGLAAIYPTHLAPLARQALESNDHSLQTFIKTATQRAGLHAYPISPEDLPKFKNLNTPEDLRERT